MGIDRFDMLFDGLMPYRGGNWNNGSQAGVFALNLNNARSNSNNNIGFRAASPVREKSKA